MARMTKLSIIVLSVSLMVLVSVLASISSDSNALAQSEDLLGKSKAPRGVMLLSCVASDGATIDVQASSSAGEAPTAGAGDDCAEVLLSAFRDHCKIKSTKGSEDGAFYTLVCKAGDDHADPHGRD